MRTDSAYCEWVSTGPAATQTLGQHLGERLRAGDVLALQGDLGTGKTTLIQGLGRGLRIEERIVSPTFVLVNEYMTPAGLCLRHADCYRLSVANTGMEVAHLGFDEWLADRQGILVVEWADRIPELLPRDLLVLALHHGDNPESRVIRLQAAGTRYVGLLQEWSSICGC